MNIRKGLSEALNFKRTDNEIVMWKKDKGANNDIENTTEKKLKTLQRRNQKQYREEIKNSIEKKSKTV